MNGDDRRAGIVLAAATVAMGLIAGVYFAYAVSVMPGLAGLDDRAFVAAMQQIDDESGTRSSSRASPER